MHQYILLQPKATNFVCHSMLRRKLKNRTLVSSLLPLACDILRETESESKRDKIREKISVREQESKRALVVASQIVYERKQNSITKIQGLELCTSSTIQHNPGDKHSSTLSTRKLTIAGTFACTASVAMGYILRVLTDLQPPINARRFKREVPARRETESIHCQTSELHNRHSNI